MARTGDIIEKPMIGDRIVFLKTAKETQGQLLQFFAVLGPIAKMRGYRAWYPQYSRGD